MISKELEQLERTAEEQRLLRMDREERRQREYARKKLSLRRKIEEVRGKLKRCKGNTCTVSPIVNNFNYYIGSIQVLNFHTPIAHKLHCKMWRQITQIA